MRLQWVPGRIAVEHGLRPEHLSSFAQMSSLSTQSATSWVTGRILARFTASGDVAATT